MLECAAWKDRHVPDFDTDSAEEEYSILDEDGVEKDGVTEEYNSMAEGGVTE